MKLLSPDRFALSRREQRKVVGGGLYAAFLLTVAAGYGMLGPYNLESPIDLTFIGIEGVSAIIAGAFIGEGLGGALRRRKDRMDRAQEIAVKA